MLKLVLVRHGQTNSNIERRYLGWTDVELNDTGIIQAYCAKEKLKDCNPDVIITSPLKRARKTAEVINECFNLDIVYDNRLKERNFGIIDNLTLEEILQRYQEQYNTWTQDWINYRFPEGENSVDSYERTVGFIEELVSGNEGKTVIIVTHEGSIKKILAYLLNMGIEGIWRFRIENCGITTVEVNNEGYAYLTGLNL